jgi:hypothetical protein
MPPLVEFQRSLATDVLFDSAASAKYLRAGPVPADVAIRVHRDSVLAALVNAIRVSCPTLCALVDAAFVEQSVRDYARARPPHGACLDDFGDRFGDFLETYPPACGFPFFADIVRFDVAIDRADHHRPGSYGAAVTFGTNVVIRLLTSLTHISTQYPVDVIRDQIEAGAIEGLDKIDMTSRAYHFALWRGESGASVRRLTRPAATFLREVLQGGDGSHAVNRALEHAGPAEVLRAIRSDILTPPICILSSE